VKKPILAMAAISLILSACSSGTNEGAVVSEPPAAVTASATAPATPEATTPAAPETSAPALSANAQLVATFVDALDALGIEHSEPKRTEAAVLSKASYDLTVNGYDSGVQVFANEEAQTAWVEASDSFGGVCVVIDGAALSLNSSEGIEDSVEIAPKIADEVGGEAHGV
jgi:hypothetical protein